MIKVGQWPEMTAALTMLTETEDKLASIKQRIKGAQQVVWLEQGKRADLVRRTADGDASAPREAIEAKAAIERAEATASMLTDALPAAERSVKDAENAVCNLQNGIYWSQKHAADEALEKAIEEVAAASDRRAAAERIAQQARASIHCENYMLLKQAKAGERLEPLL